MREDEEVALVDEVGAVIGRAWRSACHGDPSLLHGVARVLVFRPDGRLILQKRSLQTETYPGLWDISVGGHMDPGESPLETARRETREELGIAPDSFCFLYRHIWGNSFEREMIFTYRARYAGECDPDPTEVSEVRDWSLAEIEAALGSGELAPSLEEEWGVFRRNREINNE